MSLRRSFLTKRYSNIFLLRVYTYIPKRRVADRARYAANSDRRTERRAAECSEQKETRLARRRVADRARFAAISR